MHFEPICFHDNIKKKIKFRTVYSMYLIQFYINYNYYI